MSRCGLRAVAAALVVVVLESCAPGHSHDVALTAEERAWLGAHAPLRFAPDPAFAPFEWFDEEGHYRGLVADYFALIEKRLGVHIEMVRAANWEGSLRLAATRQVDGITAAQQTSERSVYLDWTPDLFEIPNVIVVRSEVQGDVTLASLTGRTVAVTRGYVGEEYLRQHFPGIRVVPMPEDGACLKEVSFGRVDAAIVNLATASYLTEHQGLTNLRAAGDSGRSYALAIGTRKDEPLLRSIMTKALASVTPSERDAIRRRWVRMETGSVVVSRKRVVRWIATGLGALLAPGLIVLVWTRALRRQVAHATAGLQTELLERRRAEAALRRSERKLSLHLEQTVVAGVEFDLDFRVVYWNAAAERIFGWSGAEVLGQSAELIVPPTDREHVKAVWRSLLDRQGGWRNTNSNVTRDGRTITCEWYNTVLNDDAGRVSGVMSLAVDVSERERREEAQARTQRLESLAVLAGGIAHDFNNLLAAILGNLTLALDDDPPAAERRELLAEAAAAANRARSLTRQLLTFARGGAPLKAPLDIGPVVEEAATFASRGASGACQVQLARGLWPVNADAGQLGQVVQNLVINALEALPGGVVEVSVANVAAEQAPGPGPKGPSVRIRVSDHGPGIPLEHRSRIFDPFYSTKGRGSGLGLAVTHSIVTRHGGAIHVQSSPGGGAIFDVYLPAELAGRPAERRPPKAPEAAPARRPRILVMDDEESLRLLAVRVLTGAGWDVEAVPDGGEAVSRWRAARAQGQPFDLVLLDLTVPGAMGGVETLAALRAIDPRVRAVVSSGYSDGPVLAESAAHGFEAAIAKPWSAEELRRLLGQLVSTDGVA